MDEYINIETKQFRGAGFMTVSKYNNSGKLIYIADKDSKCIIAIETFNYEIVGSFDGHNGVIWSLDISSDDTFLVSCSGDLSICFWKTDDGSIIHNFSEKCMPKYVCTQKKLDTNLVGIICEGLGKKSITYISIYDLNYIYENDFKEKIKILWNRTNKPTVLTWLNENILIIGCDDGKIIIKNINDIDDTEDIVLDIHHETIKSIVWNKNNTQILTSSLDCTAKQIDVSNWEIKATYISTVPINWACWNHNDRKILLGGGIEAMQVAKTSNNDLNLKIYRTSDQKLMNHISSHFGPIRYIDKSPIGKNFITASQDGTVKIYFIKDENLSISELEKNIPELQKFKNFGSYQRYKLSSEINKLENLTYKPKKNIEKKVVWVPGMPLLKNNNNINSKKIQNNSKQSEFYEPDLNTNITIVNNDNLYEIKGIDNKNSVIRVTNLPPDIQADDLNELFDMYGRIKEKDGIIIKNYFNSTMAFIKYIYSESAQKAIDNLDRTAINNYIIGVEIAKKNDN